MNLRDLSIFALLAVTCLSACSPSRPGPPAVQKGMTKAQVRAVMGEPTDARKYVADDMNKGMGAGMGFPNSLPKGQRVEVWQYRPAYVAVYFLDDSDTAAHACSTYSEPGVAY